MAVNLWETYGCVPQTVYPESYHSGLSAPLNALVKTKVREHALILRNLSKSLRLQNITEEAITGRLRGKKEELMIETYRIMTALLGVPPHPNKPFEWSYYDKNGKAGTWSGTPLEFYRTFVGKQVKSLLAGGPWTRANPNSHLAGLKLFHHKRPPERVLKAIHRLQAW